MNAINIPAETASTPIADYAFLSNCRSAALVSRTGSIDWLCFPRFDSGSLFARLLDFSAGHFSITALDSSHTSRRYRESSLVLETTFETRHGTCVLTDALAFAKGKRGHDLGENSPALLLRSVECLTGSMQLLLRFAPRPEFGLIEPLFEERDGGIFARGGASLLFLSVPTPCVLRDGYLESTVQLCEGERLYFGLEWASTSEPEPKGCSQAIMQALLADTTDAWQSWSALHQQYEGPWKELVAHSGRVLQGLAYQPTGAIIAAPTTSLPEVAGGSRNWDYRFTWIRDASITMEALWVAACPFEASRFFNFLAHAASSLLSRKKYLQIMFGIGGEHDLSERELYSLEGWNRSSPVRVGNEAWTQRQLDVYGELLRSALVLERRLGDLDEITRLFLIEVADVAAASWMKKDKGIWEVRGEPQHFVHSKLMCWVAMDCAIRLAKLLKAEDKVFSWTAVREDIRAAIESKGWSERSQAFTQAFGSDQLDASCLMISIVGFLPGDDPRVVSTIDAIARQLTDERGLVYRYRSDDGLRGEEGTFLLCSFWLAQAQALAFKIVEARRTFELAISFRNDLGLLAEEVEAGGGGLLGNFPQAFSHVGLINAAATIAEAEALRPAISTPTLS